MAFTRLSRINGDLPGSLLHEPSLPHSRDRSSPSSSSCSCSSSESWCSGEAGGDWPLAGGEACHSHVPLAAAFKPLAGQPEQDVLLRLAPCAAQSASPQLSMQHATLPFNDLSQPVLIDTPLFRGCVAVLIKNLPSTPCGMFDNRRRLMWFSIQGRFKRAVSYDSLMLGSEFDRPLQLPGAALLTRAASFLVPRMGGGVQLNAAGQHPHILAPLMAAAQVINVSLPGQQPDLFDSLEDLTLVEPGLVDSTGQPLASGKRKSHFGSRAARAGRAVTTNHVWTFQVYDQSMDYSTFQLLFPLFKLDLVQVLAGQPLQLMIKDVESSQYLMKLEVWHKRMLLHKANQPAAAAATETADQCWKSRRGSTPAAASAGSASDSLASVCSFAIDRASSADSDMSPVDDKFC